MVSLIPVIGPVLAKILAWPVVQILSLPAEQAVATVRAVCSWAIGGC